MKRILYILVLLAGLAISCNMFNDKEVSIEGREEIITLLERSLMNENGINDSAANAVVGAYNAYVTAYPESANSPEYLFKAGEVSMGLQKPMEAIRFFSRLGYQYPSHEKASISLFLQAYVTDNLLRDYDKAGELYNSFIEKYPDHPMVNDARFSIENMGKSDEELIREFEQKLVSP
jgi:tetratricopeptide (TPR) repeat protein